MEIIDLDNTTVLPFTKNTKDVFIHNINLWLMKQEDYHEDFLFTDLQVLQGEWHFCTKPCRSGSMLSDIQILTDRMCKELGYTVLR